MVLDGERTNSNRVDDETCSSDGQVLSRDWGIGRDLDAIDESAGAKEGEETVSEGERGQTGRNMGRRASLHGVSSSSYETIRVTVSSRES